jgi:peroxiredoxin
MMRTFFLFAILFISAVFYFGYFRPEHAGLQVGDPAPDFSLNTETGLKLRLFDYRGQFVLINFWATWCPPCIWEMPSLSKASEDLKDEGLLVLAISVDEEGWVPVRQFLERQPLHFPILLDTMGDVSGQYGTYQLPESYLVDSRGIIVKKYIGPHKWDDVHVLGELRALLEKGVSL